MAGIAGGAQLTLPEPQLQLVLAGDSNCFLIIDVQSVGLELQASQRWNN